MVDGGGVREMRRGAREETPEVKLSEKHGHGEVNERAWETADPLCPSAGPFLSLFCSEKGFETRGTFRWFAARGSSAGGECPLFVRKEFAKPPPVLLDSAFAGDSSNPPLLRPPFSDLQPPRTHLPDLRHPLLPNLLVLHLDLLLPASHALEKRGLLLRVLPDLGLDVH